MSSVPVPSIKKKPIIIVRKTPTVPVTEVKNLDIEPKGLIGKRKDDLKELITKMEGININHSLQSYNIKNKVDDINNLIVKDDNESLMDFEIRKQLSFHILNNKKYEMSNITAVIISRVIMNKIKYNCNYEKDVEDFITNIV